MDPGISHRQKSAGAPKRRPPVPGSSPVWRTPRYIFGTSSVPGLHQRSSCCGEVLQHQTVCRRQPPLQENLKPVRPGTTATGPTALGGLGEHLANELQPQQVHITRISSSKRKSVLLTTDHLQGQQLGVARSSNYLGVTITDDLSWTNHAETVAAKGSRTVGLSLIHI